ncbi:hypothetical protein TNCV_3167471 [Trichonephila clavipes]|uniref:Uncharacterized protein n=1 Tax=Trichonephila clavipes TaxID=2585209 RepID=A0A8X6USK0_TRICX|nr:hypothetical protein TNCV_3167471 [Trichonephila clavipes]
MATGSSLTQNHSRSQSEIQGDLNNLPMHTSVQDHENADKQKICRTAIPVDRLTYAKLCIGLVWKFGEWRAKTVSFSSLGRC